MLKVLFTQDSEAEDPLCGAPSGSEPSLFFSLGFEPVQYDFQHDFTRMTDEADGSKVLATRAIGSLFRECIYQRLSPWDRPFSCFPDLVTDLCQNPCLHEQVRLVYYQLLQISPFSVKLQGSQLSQSGLAVDLPLGIDCRPEPYCHHNPYLFSSEQYSVHLLRISCSSVRHFPDLSWIVVDLPCFSKVRSVTRWYAVLLLFLFRKASISLH